jgi:hypothetical protein
MLIFGWGAGRPKDGGAVVPHQCPHCHNDGYFRLISATKWFRLFFVPLIPYSTKHFLVCPVCTSGKQLTGHDVARARQMAALTAERQGGGMSDERYASLVELYFAGAALPDAGHESLESASSGVPPRSDVPPAE